MTTRGQQTGRPSLARSITRSRGRASHRLIIEIDDGAAFLTSEFGPVRMPAAHLLIEDEGPEIAAISAMLGSEQEFPEFRADINIIK
jgi:hypothetical protein